jgi:hypothetical protein
MYLPPRLCGGFSLKWVYAHSCSMYELGVLTEWSDGYSTTINVTLGGKGPELHHDWSAKIADQEQIVLLTWARKALDDLLASPASVPMRQTVFLG